MRTYFTLCSILLFSMLHAQRNNVAGSLDSSFGTKGTVLTYALYPIGFDKQKDGSIISAGNIGSKDSVGYFAIKYLPDGTIDTSFGNNGRAYYPDGAGYAVCMTVAPDDKILVAGYHAEMFEPSYVSIVRFNANGTNDLSFGKNGIVISSSTGNINALALQPDGKILAEGLNLEKALTMRFLPDGMPDNTFGINGKVENNFGDGSGGYTIAIQPDDKIVIGGRTGAPTAPFLARYTSSGTLHQSFGNSGNVIYNLGNIASVKDITVQADGKIVAVGEIGTNNPDINNALIFRSMPDGSLDQEFGNKGFNQQEFTTKSNLKSVVLQKDGKIVSCGSVYQAFYHNTTLIYTSIFLLERYTTDGFLNSSFGVNGNEITSLDSTIAASSVFLQGDNEKIIVGGSSEDVYDPTPNAFAIVIARYNNDDFTKKQIIIKKIKQYISTHNNADAVTLSKNITLYPNPVQNILTIKGLDAKQKYELSMMNDKGSLIVTKQVNDQTSYQFNVQDLSSGVYYVNIVANNKVVTTLKLVKE